VSTQAAADPAIVKTIEDALRQPVYFRDIIEMTKDKSYRTVLQAWGDVRSRLTMERDEFGRYWVK
jgi:hypothetical protein